MDLAASVINLVNVRGTFSVGENIIASDSAETGKLIEDSSNVDLTVSETRTFKFEDATEVFMDDDDGGQDFTVDLSENKEVKYPL